MEETTEDGGWLVVVNCLRNLKNVRLVCLPEKSLVKWIEDGVPEDPFLNPELMKNNPWVEKGKCILL